MLERKNYIAATTACLLLLTNSNAVSLSPPAATTGGGGGINDDDDGTNGNGNDKVLVIRNMEERRRRYIPFSCGGEFDEDTTRNCNHGHGHGDDGRNNTDTSFHWEKVEFMECHFDINSERNIVYHHQVHPYSLESEYPNRIHVPVHPSPSTSPTQLVDKLESPLD